MIVVTVADAAFSPFLDVWRESVVELDMEPVMYNMGGLNWGIDVKDFLGEYPKTFKEMSRAKVKCVQHARETRSGTIFTTDADAFFMKPFVESEDCDVAFYARKRGKAPERFKLMGAYSELKDNDAARRVVKSWLRNMDYPRSTDQSGINRVLEASIPRRSNMIGSTGHLVWEKADIKLIDSADVFFDLKVPEDLDRIPNHVTYVHFTGHTVKGTKLPTKMEILRRYHDLRKG